VECCGEVAGTGGGARHFTCEVCFDRHVREESSKDLGMRRWIQVLGEQSSGTQCIRRHKKSVMSAFPAIGAADDPCLENPWSDLSPLKHIFQVVDMFQDRLCVVCPMHGHGCNGEPYSDHTVVKTISPTVLALYERSKREVLEWRLTCEHEERIRLEKERIGALSEAERRIQTARLHIMEEILTLKCPRPTCRQAFLDFNGCFALTCCRCNAGFCAYCLQDCGRDAHHHVATCAYGEGRGVWGGDMHVFNVVQNKRKLRVLIQYLDSLENNDLRLAVRRAVAQDVQEVGIQLP
jgi:hypothetical protein